MRGNQDIKVSQVYAVGYQRKRKPAADAGFVGEEGKKVCEDGNWVCQAARACSDQRFGYCVVLRGDGRDKAAAEQSSEPEAKVLRRPPEGAGGACLRSRIVRPNGWLRAEKACANQLRRRLPERQGQAAVEGPEFGLLNKRFKERRRRRYGKTKTENSNRRGTESDDNNRVAARKKNE